MRRRLLISLVVLALAGAAAYSVYLIVRPRSLDIALTKYGPAARTRLAPFFKHAGLAYPPKKVQILVFKRERRLAVWVFDSRRWRYLRDYAVLAASGHTGPKLREGDYQVPEGLYRIAYLNPSSSYHLSMKVDYPNAADLAQAALDRRKRLGGDIFIHGKDLSIGCVAIGDRGIEELFTLVADSGVANTRVILAPVDLRVAGAPVAQDTPLWVLRLWQSIASALHPFPIELESDSSLGVEGMSKLPKVFPAKN